MALVGKAFTNLDPSMRDVDPLALAEILHPGLVAIVHVELQNPDWDQCRARLHGDEVSDAVAYVVQRQLTKAWRARPEAFDDLRVACLVDWPDASGFRTCGSRTRACE